MKKDKWREYWQKRAVKAEAALTTVSSIASLRDYIEIEDVVNDYFKSVAAGEVKDVTIKLLWVLPASPP